MLSESTELWQFTKSARRSKRAESLRGEPQEMERERGTGRYFWCLEVIRQDFNLAGLHTASGNNLLLERTPSTSPDTSSRHKIPVKAKEMYQHCPKPMYSRKIKQRKRLNLQLNHTQLKKPKFIQIVPN
jgi:hypothetical protein